MNTKQKVLTILCAVVLICLGLNFARMNDASNRVYSYPEKHDKRTGELSPAYIESDYPSEEAIALFIVGVIVLGAVYAGMFFVLKKKS